MSVVNAIPLLLGDEGYNISRSVRLRSSASAYFNRTPGSAGNQKTFTWSGWVKRGALSGGTLFASDNNAGANYCSFFFNSSTNQLQFNNVVSSSLNIIAQTSAVFRDPSAWYHVVFAVDTTQATNSNGVKIYVNGVQQTLSFSAYTQNTNTQYNAAVQHRLGSLISGAEYLDGYLTEVNFIDGQALTPSSFGETDAITGVWKPKKYAGTYGTNGFYLNFSDNSSNTATTIGKDYSGNGNNWTPNNISVTAGVTYDSMTDVPTLTSATAANYAVMNPLNNNTGAGWNIASFQAANLNVGSAADNQNKIAVATMDMTTGKFYWEVTIGSNFAATNTFLGMTQSNATGITKNVGIYYMNNGQKYINGTNSSYGVSYTTGDVIGFAYDADTGVLTCYKNNSSQGAIYSSGSGSSWMPTMAADNAGAGVTYYNSFNFGQRPFTYTPPTGFKALNTQNLPAPTILKGNQYFDATTYTGNGSTQSIVNAGAFQPDLVWMKTRSLAYSHGLYDSVRGVNLALRSDSTNAEQVYSSSSLTAFNSNGFTVGSYADVNPSGGAMVGWQWKANGSAVTNTSGSITSQVNAGTSQGFSVVTWTGNGSASQTVGHGLGVKPSMVIEKRRNASQNWYVYFPNIGSNGTYFEGLNTTSAGSTNSTSQISFSSTTGTIANQTDHNANGGTYVWYCFSEVAGFSKFGSYTGNGSADGPMIFTGFRPRFVMIKRTDSGGSWYMIDTARGTVNVVNPYLIANGANSEATDLSWDLLSNGFKLRSTYTEINASSGTFIYAAFAEHPFKNSLAR